MEALEFAVQLLELRQEALPVESDARSLSLLAGAFGCGVVVQVKDLAVSALARTSLSKSLHDAVWSAFGTMLEYRAAKNGRPLEGVAMSSPPDRRSRPAAARTDASP